VLVSFAVMSDSGKHHVFGPVPSRRLGRSLGVDLVPYKTCPYDCIYCQVGRTTCKTVERSEYVPLSDVLRELPKKLSASRPEVITLSGSGEPTLYSRAGELIRAVKVMSALPVVVLTNGSLLCRPEVRDELMAADIVVPSLDAGSRSAFAAVNRPHDAVEFDAMVEGLLAFSRSFGGKLLLEVFLVKGLNDSESEVKKIASLARELSPSLVQLNTVTRPPAEGFAERVPHDRLSGLARLFSSPVEVIADFSGGNRAKRSGVEAGEAFALLARRPCTLEEVAAGLEISVDEARAILKELIAQDQAVMVSRESSVYYDIKR